MRTSLGLMISVALLMSLAAGVVLADHSWNDYHWSSDNLASTVADKTDGTLYDVQAGVVEWAKLETGISPQFSTARKGNITVTEGYNPFWYGLARVFVEDGHITKGEVKLNTRLLAPEGLAAAAHVLCQEIGHVLGLDHKRDADTCMNDTAAALGLFTSPDDDHDAAQLTEIYSHTDATGGGGGGGPDCETNSNAKKCRSGKGHWVTVHVFPVP